MRSLETQFVDIKEVCKNNGLETKANAIIVECASLEEKVDRLTTLAKPFATKTKLVESFRVNFNMSEADARIAAGVERSRKNSSHAWDDLMKG